MKPFPLHQEMEEILYSYFFLDLLSMLCQSFHDMYMQRAKLHPIFEQGLMSPTV